MEGGKQLNGVFQFRDVVCGACGHDRYRILGYRGGEAHHERKGLRTTIVRCLECSQIYPNPMPFPSGSLDDLYQEPISYFHGHDVEGKKRAGFDKLHQFESALGYRGLYLDVGCGRGEYLWAAREAGWKFEGVDPSAPYLDWGRRYLGVEGRLGTLEDAHFPDNHFDVVTMGGVLEHLYDPYETFREVERVLKPGGILWLDAPNEDALYTRVGNLYMRVLGRDWVVNLAPTFPPFHVQGFNPRSLRRLLGRVALTVECLSVLGSVCPFTGSPSLRKRVEFSAAWVVNWLGNRCGAGFYMEVWARKSSC